MSGCGAPSPDGSTELGKRQIIDQANKALTTEDCATALDLLLPVYNSANSDNEIRMMTASAYACWANINYFKVMGDMVVNAGSLSSGFFNYASKLFPSKIGADHVAEGSLLSQDALMATTNSGIPILPSGSINAGSYNVGSIYPFDRTDDSNLYLLFTSLAGIGSLQNRYGNPDANFHPQAKLPWSTPANVSTDGCGYASSVLNFVDAINAAQNILPSGLKSSLGTVATTLATALDQACDFGCTGGNPGLPGWQVSGCGFASGCTTDHKCPKTLRNRNSCKAQTTDVNSCAAAGLVNMVNVSPLGWQ
ncbi:MAG: hypothetical protein ACJ763_16240 [Bdellovibrionia bacterium]